MKSVAHSLKILHDLRIVHGDLKPSNILVKRTELGYTSKLIDFDSSYIAGNPPPPEEIVGTINYYSPELLGYIQEAGVPPGQLGRGLRRLRPRPDLHRVPHRRPAALRRRDLPRTRGRRPQRRDAAHPPGRHRSRAGRPGRPMLAADPAPPADDRQGARHLDEHPDRSAGPTGRAAAARSAERAARQGTARDPPGAPLRRRSGAPPRSAGRQADLARSPTGARTHER